MGLIMISNTNKANIPFKRQRFTHTQSFVYHFQNKDIVSKKYVKMYTCIVNLSKLEPLN